MGLKPHTRSWNQKHQQTSPLPCGMHPPHRSTKKDYQFSYKQLSGTAVPVLVPRTLLQEEEAGLSMYFRFMSCSLIPVHGLLVLHSNITAFRVADVPRTFLYVTPLIFTPELCRIKSQARCLSPTTDLYIIYQSCGSDSSICTWLGQP